jgi:hypothetical protein
MTPVGSMTSSESLLALSRRCRKGRQTLVRRCHKDPTLSPESHPDALGNSEGDAEETTVGDRGGEGGKSPNSAERQGHGGLALASSAGKGQEQPPDGLMTLYLWGGWGLDAVGLYQSQVSG